MAGLSIVLERRRWYESRWLHSWTAWAMAGLIAVVTGLDVARIGIRGITLVSNNIIAPFLLFLAISRLARDDALRLRRIPLAIVALGVLESFLCLLAKLEFIPQPYAHELATYYWFRAVLGQRQLGTMDHPLLLGLFLCMALPLCGVLRDRRWRVAAAAILLSGLALTGARAALLIALMIFAALLWWSFPERKARWTAFGLAIVATVALVASGLLTSTLARFANDDGSTSFRAKAYSAFGRVWQHYIFVGGGSYANAGVSDKLGLPSSFESALLSYTIDYGLILTLAYFGLLAVLVLRAKPGLFPLTSFLACFVLVMTFSSLSNNGTAGFILWTAAACSATLHFSLAPSGGHHGSTE